METCSIKEYIESKTSLDAKIAALDALIDAMILNAADGVGNSSLVSYSVDDGQMKVVTNYRSVDDIAIGIKSLEKIKQLYVNRRNGNITVLRGKLNY